MPNDHGFGDDDFDWAGYDKYRAPYPEDVWKIFYDFHNAGSAKYDNAMDLGCGSGVGALGLARKFKHVLASDPNDYNLEQCRKRAEMPAYIDSLLPHKCTFSYKTGPAEKAVAEPASQDMVTMFTAIHWTDNAATMRQIAAALKPGGTAAIAVYDSGKINGNERANEALNHVWACNSGVLAKLDKDHPVHIAGDQLCRGLNCVPIEQQYWEPGARRLWFNTDGKQEAGFSNWGLDSFSTAESKVNPDFEHIECIEDFGGWQKQVDADWVQGHFDSFQFKGLLEDPKFQAARDNLKKVIREVGGHVTFQWGGCVLLARRKA